MQETIIAKRYAKAVSQLCSTQDIVQMHAVYALISKACGVSKFSAIVTSKIISKEEKLTLIKSFIDIPMNIQTERLLHLLVYEDRIFLLPFVVLELKKIIDSEYGQYQATLHVKRQLAETQLASIRDNLGRKLGITLDIVQEVDPSLEGIKLEVVDLGIEVAFLKDRFTSDLQDFILKAV